MSHPHPFSTLASKPPQNPPTATSPPNSNQPPPSRPPPPRSPSSTNYAAALAAAKARAAQSPTAPGLYNPYGNLATQPTAPTDASGTPASDTTSPIPPTPTASKPVKLTTSTGKHTGTVTPPAGMAVDREGEGREGRPGVERVQSWSEQDMKRVMQERLLRGEGAGFTRGRG